MAKQRRVLITFLGKGNRTQGREGYNKAEYSFGNGVSESSRVFGVALVRHLRKSDTPIDLLVVAGTASSDWDIFYEELGLMGDESPEAQIAFDEAVRLSGATKDGNVTDNDVAPLAGRIGTALGVRCRCLVIGYGENREGEAALLRQLVGIVAANDSVILDVTHGLRHLPVFAMIAALYLKAAKRAEIEAIYYGALDLRFLDPEKRAPVIRLEELLNIAAWIQALQSFDKDADFGVFVPLLEREKVDDQALVELRRGAELERTARIAEARQALQAFRSRSGDLSALAGPAGLFASALHDRLAWIDEPDTYGHLRRLAFLHKEHGDLLRAALFGLEGFITRLAASQGLDPRSQREQAESALADSVAEARKRLRKAPSPADEALLRRSGAYHKLRMLRNAMVHVDNKPPRHIASVLASVDRTRETIGTLLTDLLPRADG